MKPIAWIATLFTFLSPLAFASESLCPFPTGMQASITASKGAIAAKNSGVEKAELLDDIPQDEPLSQWLTDIVHDVYDYPTLQPDVYAAYRFELCFVTQSHPKHAAEIEFSEAYPLLKACESLNPEGARPPCAMRVVHTISGIPE